MHPYRTGNAAWVKEWNVQPLKPHWRGPFVVILSTPTAVKVAEIAPWIYHRLVKPASLKWGCIPGPASLCKITPGTLAPFLSETPIEERQLETTNNETTALL
jgi:hypothetical protein